MACRESKDTSSRCSVARVVCSRRCTTRSMPKKLPTTQISTSSRLTNSSSVPRVRRREATTQYSAARVRLTKKAVLPMRERVITRPTTITVR